MISLDFETFWIQRDYSLSTMTTEEYIRDPRFEVIGVTVAVDDGPIEWFSGSAADTLVWLRRYDWGAHVACSHNAMFDMAILSWRFGIVPRAYADTLSMARKLFGIEQSCSLKACAERYGLPEKGSDVAGASGIHRVQFEPSHLREYGEYCKHDTDLCRQLYRRMRPQIPIEEMHAIDWTIQAYARPTLVIDKPLAEKALYDFRTARAQALQQLGVTQDALRSDQMMADMLLACGVDPPRKYSEKRTDEAGEPLEMWAFAKSDIEFLDLLEHPDPRVAALVEARLENKTSIVESRLQAFVEIAERGTLPYPLAYAAAIPTDRWQAAGQQKINLQNLPRAKPGERSPLRDAIRPPKGYRLGVIDLSQIELRVSAWLAGQNDVLDRLRAGLDEYAVGASGIYGYTVTKHTHPAERFVGKVEKLSSMYGVGGKKFTHMLRAKARQEGLVLADESEEFGQRVIDTYRRDNLMIVAFWRECGNALEAIMQGRDYDLGPLPVRNGRIMMPDGMSIYYPNLRRYTSANGKVGLAYDKFRGRGQTQPKWIYGGLLFENLCQRLARTIFRDGLHRLREFFWVVGSVHDEALFLVPETADMEQANSTAHWCMTQPVTWAPTLPVEAEGKIGDCYGDVK